MFDICGRLSLQQCQITQMSYTHFNWLYTILDVWVNNDKINTLNYLNSRLFVCKEHELDAPA